MQEGKQHLHVVAFTLGDVYIFDISAAHHPPEESAIHPGYLHQMDGLHRATFHSSASVSCYILSHSHTGAEDP